MRNYINRLNGYVVFAFMLMAVTVFADSVRRNTIMGTAARRNTVEWDFVEPSAGSAMNLVPGTDNTNSIGTSSLRIKDFRAVTATFTGPITANAGVSLFTSTAPRTAVGVAALYSAYTLPAGTVFYNSTSGVLCVSSSTAQSSITVSTGTGACPS